MFYDIWKRIFKAARQPSFEHVCVNGKRSFGDHTECGRLASMTSLQTCELCGTKNVKCWKYTDPTTGDTAYLHEDAAECCNRIYAAQRTGKNHNWHRLNRLFKFGPRIYYCDLCYRATIFPRN